MIFLFIALGALSLALFLLLKEANELKKRTKNRQINIQFSRPAEWMHRKK